MNRVTVTVYRWITDSLDNTQEQIKGLQKQAAKLGLQMSFKKQGT